MRNAPEGNQMVSRFSGCVLADLPGRRLVWGSLCVRADQITAIFRPVSLQTLPSVGGTQMWMLETVVF